MTLMWSAKFCLEEALMDYFRPGTCLADCVENTHGQVRDVNPLPDAKLYLSILKGICLGQLFREKRKRGSSYELDDTKGYLSWLGDIKKMEQEVDAEAAEDRLVFIESPFDPVDYCQARAIAFHAGYVLFKVIKEKRKCDKCMPGMHQAGGQGGQLPAQILALQKAPPGSDGAPHYYLPPRIFDPWCILWNIGLPKTTMKNKS